MAHGWAEGEGEGEGEKGARVHYTDASEDRW